MFGRLVSSTDDNAEHTIIVQDKELDEHGEIIMELSHIIYTLYAEQQMTQRNYTYIENLLEKLVIHVNFP